MRGRVQAILSEMLALNLTVSNDRLWDTSVMFQVAFSFPGARAHWDGARRFGNDRLDEPVWRKHNIAVTDETRMTRMVAADSGNRSQYGHAGPDRSRRQQLSRWRQWIGRDAV